MAKIREGLELYDQIKAGGSDYRLEDGMMMSADDAANVNHCYLTCCACGAEVKVETEIPKVKIHLKEIKAGDVRMTTPVPHCLVEEYDLDEIERRAHWQRYMVRSKASRRISLEEYLEVQSRIFPNENNEEPRGFEFKEGGTKFSYSFYYSFEVKPKN